MYKVLLINPDISTIVEEAVELSKRELKIIQCTNFDDAILKLREDGSIHSILTEWEVPVTDKSRETVNGIEMFSEFLKIRYDVNIFLYTTDRNPKNVFTGGKLNGYFYKGDKDFDDIAVKIKAEVISSKNRAPFFEKLVEYSKRANDGWHTPGHAAGYSVKNSPWVRDYYEFFGPNLFCSDLSVSVPTLDSLLHPGGVIKEAQELAARAFSARYTFFSTNGTSTSNKVLLQTLVRPGEAVILDRNCHKSVHYGIIISGAEPIYLMPSVNNNYGIFGPVPKVKIIETMDRAINAGKKVKVLFLTNCTYDGLIYDIADIVKEAHNRNIKVVVDEAWFGYARFHHEFYPCAMEAGADYSTQSTHKTMSAFSQASMIHIKDPDFENIQDFFLENFNMHTSTSPQYPMIASLDVARKQMVMEGYSLLSQTLEMSNFLRKAINSLKKFKVLELNDLISEEIKHDGIRLDKTKLTIDVSGTGLQGKDIEHILATKHNIQIEKTTFNTISILMTIGATNSKINRLFLALESIEKSSGNVTLHKDKILSEFKMTLSEMKFRPRDAFYCQGEKVLLKEAKNRISTAMIVPYPPGIPLLVPGQLITEEIVNTLEIYKDYGVEIHGLSGSEISVITAAEEEELKNKGLGVTDITMF
ncbi:MAG: aminotransferase class I/II-fold pyridoxal phosphate-dependent enzyme [Candidatus Wallbacteria bacterium]